MPNKNCGTIVEFDELSPTPSIRFNGSGAILRASLSAKAMFGIDDNSQRTLEAILPDAVHLDLAQYISVGKEATFCSCVDDRHYHVVLRGYPEYGLGQLSALDITEYRSMGEDLVRARVERRHQVKELSCLYGLAEALSTRETVAEICEDVVRLIPAAWHHADIARARIVLGEVEYVSQPFEMTQWGQSAVIIVDGVAQGMVQVFYIEPRSLPTGDGHFLSAERHLLDAIARTLGEAIGRRSAEAENRDKTRSLARERNQLETILRSIGEGVVVTDGSTRVVLMNRSAQELLGAPGETIGTPFLSLIEDGGFIEAWRTTAVSGEEFAKVDLAVGSEEEARTLWATRSVIRGLGGGGTWHVTILQDVTKERRIDQMKSDFVSAVSHELRTPMTSIKGFVKTILNKPNMPVDVQRRFLSIIDEDADRLIRLIEELLLIARLESGYVLLERDPINLAVVTGHVAASLGPFVEERGLELVQDIPRDLAEPQGDAKKLQVVLHNLVENAIKFTPKGGTVTLQGRNAADHVVLRVSDTGMGIPRGDLERIFDRFYRVHREGELAEGTGLGLFIVNEMVKLHGGWVDVTSKVGKGSTFTVCLPLIIPRERGTG